MTNQEPKTTDYCSVTLRTTARDEDNGRPLDQYEPSEYAIESGNQAKTLDAAVSLTASRWGPPFSTNHHGEGVWWNKAYECACRAVEAAIVDALAQPGVSE